MKNLSDDGHAVSGADTKGSRIKCNIGTATVTGSNNMDEVDAQVNRYPQYENKMSDNCHFTTSDNMFIMIGILRSRRRHGRVNISGLDTRPGCRYDQNSPPPLFNVSLCIYIYMRCSGPLLHLIA